MINHRIRSRRQQAFNTRTRLAHSSRPEWVESADSAFGEASESDDARRRVGLSRMTRRRSESPGPRRVTPRGGSRGFPRAPAGWRGQWFAASSAREVALRAARAETCTVEGAHPCSSRRRARENGAAHRRSGGGAASSSIPASPHGRFTSRLLVVDGGRSSSRQAASRPRRGRLARALQARRGGRVREPLGSKTAAAEQRSR